MSLKIRARLGNAAHTLAESLVRGLLLLREDVISACAIRIISGFTSMMAKSVGTPAACAQGENIY